MTAEVENARRRGRPGAPSSWAGRTPASLTDLVVGAIIAVALAYSISGAIAAAIDLSHGAIRLDWLHRVHADGSARAFPGFAFVAIVASGAAVGWIVWMLGRGISIAGSAITLAAAIVTSSAAGWTSTYVVLFTDDALRVTPALGALVLIVVALVADSSLYRRAVGRRLVPPPTRRRASTGAVVSAAAITAIVTPAFAILVPALIVSIELAR